ncbi:TlyA family RNA methyltransferase [Acholeplasma sp. OttesenSCG-928-E16]|nr:TlyA family RNA methyltransferase [Acholeplasma sp. OttesenSCG-928-E16]
MRLDVFLVERKLVESRSKASDLIKRKLVLVDNKVATKSGFDVNESNEVKIIEQLEYVSRAGIKLKNAIDSFNLNFTDKIIIDVGSSTGGFTDCALQHGAKKIYAFDIGNKQLHESLRNNAKIELHEDTNILDVSIKPSDFILIDVSFTSIMPIIEHLKEENSVFVALIKPQFEAGKILFKNGVIKDKNIHIKVLIDIIDKINQLGFNVYGLISSGLKGKAGNQEYFIVFDKVCNHLIDTKLIKDVVNNA